MTDRDTARELAIKAHGDQRYGARPYVVHLDAVVSLLDEHGHADCVVAGYLHDTLEDTALGYADIEERFGSQVANIVQFCSDAEGANRAARKAATYARMKQDIAAGPEWIGRAITTKVADRLANVSAALADNPRLLAVYQSEHATFREALYREGDCDSMWSALSETLEKGNR